MRKDKGKISYPNPAFPDVYMTTFLEEKSSLRLGLCLPFGHKQQLTRLICKLPWPAVSTTKMPALKVWGMFPMSESEQA